MELTHLESSIVNRKIVFRSLNDERWESDNGLPSDGGQKCFRNELSRPIAFRADEAYLLYLVIF